MAKASAVSAFHDFIKLKAASRSKKGKKGGAKKTSTDVMNKTAGTGSFTEPTQGSQAGKKEPQHSGAGKNVKAEVAIQLQEMIRDYFVDNRDLALAKLMANRTGMIINDIQVSKLLADSTKAKERYILILESSTFDPAVKVIAAQPDPASSSNSLAQGTAGAAKESKEDLNKKMSNFRLNKKEIRSSLLKKYRKAITDKILSLFEI